MIVNGRQIPLESLPEASILALIESFALKPEQVAVEHNGEIAPRSSWSELNLSEEDRIELIHFVGGGRS